ncbi:TadE family protein [Lachnospira multipara]|uniref:TadE-like protein n=1 Tax=Lachnospira multipara TaxID=28051 RepID=A0A1H5U307_9FIRM|nr:TadE/TadG family type IV pilus assembly protein [Lachnospira multipara]SEF68621.1 TadE-like protein [Lachnospira multipara]
MKGIFKGIKTLANFRFKAVYTLENAVIVPIFFMVYIISISVAIYMHDRIILRNALEQAAIEYEYRYINAAEVKDKNEMTEEKFATKVKDYIDAKTLYLNDTDIIIQKKDNNIKITAKASFPLVTAYVGKSINTSEMISVNNPKKWIRITKALKEAVD